MSYWNLVDGATPCWSWPRRESRRLPWSHSRRGRCRNWIHSKEMIEIQKWVQNWWNPIYREDSTRHNNHNTTQQLTLCFARTTRIDSPGELTGFLATTTGDNVGGRWYLSQSSFIDEGGLTISLLTLLPNNLFSSYPNITPAAVFTFTILLHKFNC